MVRSSDVHGIVFVGRMDDQVKINGYRVELLEIDAVLRRVAQTPEVAALPWPVSALGQADQVVGFVVNSNITQAEIRKGCREMCIRDSFTLPRPVLRARMKSCAMWRSHFWRSSAKLVRAG